MQKRLLNLVLFTLIFFSFQPTYIKSQEYTATKSMGKYNNIYHEKFKDLLLVIHFNYPHYSNIQFLKELYSPIFENIVFYGEKPDPNVINVYSYYGFLLSDVLQDVLTKFPQYKGYLVLQDDCILNFWNCLPLDQNKIWFATKFNIKYNMNIANINKGDVWWDRIVNGVKTIKSAKLAYDNLTLEDKNIIQKNLGKDNIAGQSCDFFYFPSRLNKSIIRLSQIFKNVFCEAAIPNMLFCLDLIENFEKLDMAWAVGESWTGIPPLTIKNYPKNIHWLHPVKLSSLNNRAIINEIFNKKLQITS